MRTGANDDGYGWKQRYANFLGTKLKLMIDMQLPSSCDKRILRWCMTSVCCFVIHLWGISCLFGAEVGVFFSMANSKLVLWIWTWIIFWSGFPFGNTYFGCDWMWDLQCFLRQSSRCEFSAKALLNKYFGAWELFFRKLLWSMDCKLW